MDNIELLPGDLVLWQNYQYNIIAIGKTTAYIGFHHTGTDGSKVYIKSYVPIKELKFISRPPSQQNLMLLNKLLNP